MVYLVMDGELVRSLREDRDLTKRGLAEEAGISVSTAYRVEREEPVTFRTGRAVPRLGACARPRVVTRWGRGYPSFAGMSRPITERR